MNIIDDAKVLLELSGYRTKYLESDADTLYFEDDSLLGAVMVFSTFHALLSQWEEKKDSFLTKNAGKLRGSRQKAWNIYTFFLTPEEAGGQFLKKFLEIEDDLQGTRKIARGGIRTREDVVQALYPILPIQHPVVLQPENFVARVKERIQMKEQILNALLGSTEIHEIANLLIEEE